MEITNTRVSEKPAAKTETGTRPHVMVIAGARAGELIALTGERGVFILGRSPEADIRLEDLGVSREHVELRVEAEGRRVSFRDLGSTNGTLLNGERSDGHALRDGDKLSVGAATLLLFSHTAGIEAGFQRGRFMSAVRDPATAALKREVFLERLRQEVSFSRRHGAPLSVLAWSLDGFAALEGRLGPAATQECLSAVARAVDESLPEGDVLALLAPSEFVVACRETDLHAASERAARLRAAVAATKLAGDGNPGPLTASVGVALCQPGIDKAAVTPEALVRNARAALEAARTRGGDRVEIDATAAGR
jgi:diguanylate cyclase (GGDEF)-like protein